MIVKKQKSPPPPSPSFDSPYQLLSFAVLPKHFKANFEELNYKIFPL